MENENVINLIRRREEIVKGRTIITEKVKIKGRPNYHKKNQKTRDTMETNLQLQVEKLEGK